MMIGSSGSSNVKWDILYSLNSDFSNPTVLFEAGGSAKDTPELYSKTDMGVSIPDGSTIYLRIYPYYTTTGTGKSIMLKNVTILGATQ